MRGRRRATDQRRLPDAATESAGRLVALKLATTLDGRIATRPARANGSPARRRARARMAARAPRRRPGSSARRLADDPSLTCRLPGLAGQSPVRIVLDSQGRLTSDGTLAGTAR